MVQIQAADPVEISRIRIENVAGGRVQVSLDQGKTYVNVGKVWRAAMSTLYGFPAAAYLPDSTVAATAVHGIRVKVGMTGSPTDRKPLTISVVPAEFVEIPHGYGGHIPYDSGIYTDIPSGSAIFRSLAPFAGNPVRLERNNGLVDIPQDWQPCNHDVIVIITQLPRPYLKKLQFENKEEGAVTAEYTDGKVERVATVIKPVKGVGRFDGTSYTGVGLINTNHGGVVTVSTAPISKSKLFEGNGDERRGGFEIQPSEHYKTQPWMTQAMVVGPVDDKPLEGRPPIFRGYIGLAYDPDNPTETTRVEVSVDGTIWQPMPKAIGKDDEAATLKGIKFIRMLFPSYAPEFLAKCLDSAKNQFALREKNKKNTLAKGKVKQKNILSGLVILRMTKCPEVGYYVTFYLDGQMLCATSQPPYEYIWDSGSVENGVHDLEIRVEDSTGREINSEKRSIFVDNP